MPRTATREEPCHGERTSRPPDRIHDRQRRRGAGGAHRALAGGAGRGRDARTHRTRAGQAQAFNHLDKADTFPVDRAIRDADPAGYDALVLPGGVANPDQLRTIPAAVEFARALFQAGKPAAVICHGPWTLVEADLVRGRTLTSWPSLQTDIRNAGGNWVDSEVQVCAACQRPGDQPQARRPACLLQATGGGVSAGRLSRYSRRSATTPKWSEGQTPSTGALPARRTDSTRARPCLGRPTRM